MSKFLKTISIDGRGGPYKSFNSDYHLVREDTKVIIVGTITSPQGRGANKGFYYMSPYNPMYRIIDAYFEKQSTTDYNGVYKGKYLDFEAKSTKNKTSFPLANITPHQIIHLKRVVQHGGIAFFIIGFQTLNEVYLLDSSFVVSFYENGDRKSIPYQVFKEEGLLIKQGYNPRLHYLEAVEEKYFR